MAKTKKRSLKRTSGSIRAKTKRSAYASRLGNAPRDAEVSAEIDSAVREGEALRAEIERRIEQRLEGF